MSNIIWGVMVRILVLTFATAVLMPAAEKGSKSERRGSKSETTAAAKVDLNTADVATLEQLPGVGRTTAEAIVKARPFSTVNDLERVPGIGPGKLENLRDRVTVSSSGRKGKGAAKKSDRAMEKASPRSTGSTSAESGERTRERSSGAATRTRKVDVNTAGIEELESLPGVGPQTAKAIVAGRPFTSVDDLERVPGIGAARLEGLRDHVTVSRTSNRKRSESASTRTSPSRERDDDLEPTGRDRSTNREGAAVSGRRVNLNTATLAELEALPEIGPVRARAIIEARPFKSVDDLKRVKGIKDIRLEELRPHVTVQ